MFKKQKRISQKNSKLHSNSKLSSKLSSKLQPSFNEKQEF